MDADPGTKQDGAPATWTVAADARGLVRVALRVGGLDAAATMSPAVARTLADWVSTMETPGSVGTSHEGRGGWTLSWAGGVRRLAIQGADGATLEAAVDPAKARSLRIMLAGACMSAGKAAGTGKAAARSR